MNFTEENFLLYREFYNLMMGRKLGNGIARVVFTLPMLPDYVAKVENTEGSFQNVLEWETWTVVQHEKDAAKWFAPCKWISENGRILIMARTTEPASYPDMLPAFLTDTKRRNYGMYKGRFVCHDYGTNLMMSTGTTKRMRKVEWWGDE